MVRPSRRLEHKILVFIALFAVAGIASLSATAGSGHGESAAAVKGAGSGILIDPDGNEFRLRSFRVRGDVAADASARGKIRFVWRGSFPRVWGDPVCEGTCDTIILSGRVDSGSVALGRDSHPLGYGKRGGQTPGQGGL